MARFRKVIVTATVVSLLMSANAITFANATSRNTDDITIDSIQEEIPLLQKNEISISEGSTFDLSQEENADLVKELRKGTIVISYTSTSAQQYQSLFSVSNRAVGNENRHFHLYVTNSGALGMELRNTDQVFKYTMNRPACVRGIYKGKPVQNTVAFTADEETKTYTLYANGELVTTLHEEEYQFIQDITGTTDVTLGGTIRGGKTAYPFGGVIHDVKVYGEVLTEQQLKDMTTKTQYGTKIFYAGDGTESNYYRIPSLLTLKSGAIASSADARYGGTHDSKSNIDTAFSISYDGGKTFSKPTLPFCFDDYAPQAVEWPREVGARDLQIQGSASFIDPQMVQDKQTGRLFLFVDVMPAGIGSSNASVGSGYKEINGKKYLKLHWQGDGSSTYNYTVRENGVIYNDVTGEPTEYAINEKFELLKNGEPLFVKQYQVRFSNGKLLEEASNKDVAMNVFYKDSMFKVFPTAYLGMKYSDDEGKTWSEMKLMNQLKDEKEKLLITGPGVGHQIENGQYKGRILVPVYMIKSACFGVLYSDDHGITWNLSKGPNEGSAATAEAQVIEFPDGTLAMFERTSVGKIAMCKSLDGGITWGERELLDGMTATSYGTQVSVINYSSLIDGKQAIILSAPNSTSGRRDGKIRIGLITDTGQSGYDKYSIDWKYCYSVDTPQSGYSYSCLTELPNGNIGVLYEKYDSWSRGELHLKNILSYEEYEVSELKTLQ